MSTRKPTLEKISPEFGSSIKVMKDESYIGEYKPFWHFHPEIQLVYVNKGKGKRHIGNHISYFTNSQLLLIGSNLPHNVFTKQLTKEGSQTIVQFRPEFLGEHFFNVPEMQGISDLFELAKNGIIFGKKTKQKIGKKIEKLSEKEGFKKILLKVYQINKDFVSISIEDNGIGREASTKINQNKLLKRKSVGISLTKARLANFSKDYTSDYNIRIKDLYDLNKNPIGTKVIVDIPINSTVLKTA